MKRPKHLLPLMVLAVGLLMTACSSDSPTDKFVEIFDNATSQVEAIETAEEAEQLRADGYKAPAEQIDELFVTYKDYVLTDDDKASIKQAMRNFYRASIAKSTELDGSDSQGLDETAEAVMQMTIYPVIDNATTFGDLAADIHVK